MSSSTDANSILAEIRIPRETVNDDVVTVQDWHAQHGESVKAKQHIVSIETSKAVLEVESDAEGFLEILHPKGAEVPIGELIGRVLTSAPAPTAPRAQASE
ncbi:MAG TPA: lipoyl domain-containing protein, partial [Phycisphaerales bacterium]|nr:lipoyl domain-containing protein [Phycisphaerales bacterium]